MSNFPKGRVLGVDAGTVRTGLAVSDKDGFLASALCTVKSTGIRALAKIIAEKSAELEVRMIVIGNPINMNGTFGPSASRIARLSDEIKLLTDIPVTLFDERCSTMVATSILNITDTVGAKRKAVIDNLSAEIILQDYLDFARRNNSK